MNDWAANQRRSPDVGSGLKSNQALLAHGRAVVAANRCGGSGIVESGSRRVAVVNHNGGLTERGSAENKAQSRCGKERREKLLHDLIRIDSWFSARALFNHFRVDTEERPCRPRVIHAGLRKRTVLIYSGDRDIFKTTLKVQRYRRVRMLHALEPGNRFIKHRPQAFRELLSFLGTQLLNLAGLAIDLYFLTRDLYLDVIRFGLSRRRANLHARPGRRAKDFP